MSDDERLDDVQVRRSRVLERDLAHFRDMAATGDVAREVALWEALADEVERYLRPPQPEPSLFDEDEGAV